MKLRIRDISLASVIGVALAMPVAAQAQADPNDIVVTARRVEERLQDVPISITVFNQEALSDRNVTNAQDLATYTPSLSATTGFGSENTTFALRGFVQETGTAPSVGVYFADVVAPRGPSQGFPAGDGAGPGMFFDLQNVQVLKGPQGTLFGRNTTGGAVLLVPQKPTDQLEGYVEGSLGTYDMRRIQAVLNVPVSDRIRVRIGVDHQKRDGFMKNITAIGPRDFDNINYVALRGSVVWDVTDDIESYTVASYVNSNNNGHIAKAVTAAPSLDPFGGLLAFQVLGHIAAQDAAGFHTVTNDMPDPYQKTRQWQVINNTKWQATDNLTVRNIISYAQAQSRTHTSLFGTQFFMPQGALAPAVLPFFPGLPSQTLPFNFAVIRHLPGGYSSNQSTFTEEFRLEGTAADGALNYQGGVYYEDSKPRGFIGSQSATFLSCTNPDALVCSDVIPSASGMNYTAAKYWFRSTGLYAQATYAVTDQIKLTGGLRYTWDKVTSESRRITYIFPMGVINASPTAPVVSLDPLNPATAAVTHCTDQLPVRVAPLCGLTESRNFGAPTWVLGIDYNPTPDMMIYGKYTRGYRTGNIKSDVPIEFHVFEPEKVDTFEMGIKTSFSGAVRGTFNVSAFYNNFSNQQIQLGFLQNLNRRDRVTGAPLPPISVPGNAGPVNVGKSRIWGIEADATIHLLEGLRLDAAYAYLNTRVKEVATATLPSDNAYIVSAPIAVGDELILSPKHKLTLTGTYTLPLDESLGKISLSATYLYSSKQLANYQALRNPAIVTATGGFNTSVMGARNLLNLNLNWDNVAGGPFDLSVFATNVTNAKYYTNINGLIGLGFETATLGEPRMVGARLKFRFGGAAD